MPSGGSFCGSFKSYVVKTRVAYMVLVWDCTQAEGRTKIHRYTMLLDAVRQGRIYMVKYLLDSTSININETDKQGQTALIKACLLEDSLATTRKKLTRILLSKGGSVSNVDIFGRNVLMWACFREKLDVVEILLGRSLMDLDFNCVDGDGNTALHYVASAGNVRLTTMLVEAMKRFGICVDKRNNEGATPLLLATKHGKEKCARVLLDNGASPNIIDQETLLTAKELAESGHFTSLAQLISTSNSSSQSQCTIFPSETDDNNNSLDDTTEVLGTKQGCCFAKSALPSLPGYSTGIDVSKLCANRSTPGRRALSASMANRKERQRLQDEEKTRKRGESFTEMSPREREKRFSQMSQDEKQNSFLKSKNGFLELPVADFPNAPDCRSTCVSSKSVARPTSLRENFANSADNPYDLRDFKSVLSLYGEQRSSTFRIGFPIHAMSAEEFQECLKAMTPVKRAPPAVNYRLFTRRPSSSTDSSTIASSAPRRQSVLLDEKNYRTSSDPSVIRHRENPQNIPVLKGVKRIPPLVRNFTEPVIHVRLPVASNSSLRRHSLMTSTQLQYSNLTNR